MHKFVVVFLFFLNVGSLSAQQQIEAELNPRDIMIGDAIQLNIKVPQTPTKQILPPVISDSTIGTFELVEIQKPDTLYSGNRKIINYKYIITNFEDSQQTFPKLALASSSGDSFYTSPILVLVKSPNIDSLKDIKPIKPIIQVPLSKEELVSYLFMSAILLALMLLLYFVYIKWIRKEALFDSNTRKEPPHVWALKELKNIENKQLWQSGYVKEYYDQTTDIIRNYIEQRFGLKALEQTTPQILESIESLELHSEVYTPLSKMLHLADLAKFAKETPSEENNQALIAEAYKFIQNTQSVYDSNKTVNAQKVKKFYGQNQYYYRPMSINQAVLKILIYGVCSTFLVISIMLILAYATQFPILMIFIADYPFVFFGGLTLLGVVISALWALVVQNNMRQFSILFDHDAIFIRKFSKSTKWLFSEMIKSERNKNNDLVVYTKYGSKIELSKYLEYADEIAIRINENIHSTIEPTSLKS